MSHSCCRPQKRLGNVEAPKVAMDYVWDSASILTSFREELSKFGVVFCSISEAVKEYPDLVRQHLGSVVSVVECCQCSLSCWRCASTPRLAVVREVLQLNCFRAAPRYHNIWSQLQLCTDWHCPACRVAGTSGRQLLRGAQLRGVLRRQLRVHSQGRQVPHGAVHLLPHQCAGVWPGARPLRPHAESSLQACLGQAGASAVAGCMPTNAGAQLQPMALHLML